MRQYLVWASVLFLSFSAPAHAFLKAIGSSGGVSGPVTGTGSDTEVIFNSSGTLTGSPNLTFDGTGITTGSLVIDNTTFDADSLVTTSANPLALTATDASLDITIGTGTGDFFQINGSNGLTYDGENNVLSIGAAEFSTTVNGVSKTSTLSTHITGGSQDYTWMSHVHSNTVGPVIAGGRTRGSEASPGIIQDNDNLLDLFALGYDGTDYERAAAIHMDVDGTPGNDDMPGRIVFLTTADGATSPTEVLRLDSNQDAIFAGNVIAPSLTCAPNVTQAITAVSDTVSSSGCLVEVTPDADYVMTATPSIAAGVNGQILILHNASTTRDFALQDDTILSGSDVFLGGAESTVKPLSTMLLHYTTEAASVGWHVISNPNSASAGASAELIPVRNTSGGGFSAGDLVYIMGYNIGQARITVALADANGAGTFPAIGFVTTAIGNNANGEMVVLGDLISLVNTSTASAGDGMWMSTTPGAVVFIRPTTDKIQQVGIVTRSNASGNIFVLGAGRPNDTPEAISATTLVLTGDIDAANFCDENGVNCVDPVNIVEDNVATEFTATMNFNETALTALGADLVTNGDFTTDTNWTKGTGWTVDAGDSNVATTDASQVGDSDLTEDTLVLVSGKTYEVTFTVSSWTAGVVTPVLGTQEGTDRGSAATFTEYIVANGTDLNMQANASGDLSIDNVIVKLANVSWDLAANQAAVLTLDGNLVMDNPTNHKAGATYVLVLIQDGTGSRTILSWGSEFLWSGGTPPVLSTGAGKIDLASCYDTGSTLLCVFQGDFQ